MKKSVFINPFVDRGFNYPNLNIILTFWCKYLKYNI